MPTDTRVVHPLARLWLSHRVLCLWRLDSMVEDLSAFLVSILYCFIATMLNILVASMSGIHGLATTFGRIAYDNHSDSTMIKAGPMSASSQDAALTYAALAPAAAGNFYSILYDGGIRGPPQPQLTQFMQTQDLTGVRVGIFPEWFNDSVPAIQKRCYEVVSYLQSRGATVVKVSIPHLQLMSLSHGVKISTEFAMDNEKDYFTAPSAFEPNTRIVVGLGLTATAVEALAMDKLRAWSFKFIEELYEREGLTAIVNPTIGEHYTL